MCKGNKLIFLFLYLFLFGIVDGIFFIGIGNFFSNFFLGSTSIFLITEFIALLILIIVNIIDYKFEPSKFLIISHIIKISIIFFVLLFFNFSSFTIISLSFVLIFFSSIDKMFHFDLTIKFINKETRKKNNSLIIILNQTSRILGYLIAGNIFLKTNKLEHIFYFEGLMFIIFIFILRNLSIEEKIKSTIKIVKWKELFYIKEELLKYIIFIILISSNGIILSSNSILGFEFGMKNIDKVVIYQSTSILGSIFALIIIVFLKNHLTNNKIILFGLLLQSICFFLFNFEQLRLLNFIVISTIGFINLSIYITKIQKISENKLGNKIYTFREIFRSLNSLVILFLFKYISKISLIPYNIIVMSFCILIFTINISLISKKILSYEI